MSFSLTVINQLSIIWVAISSENRSSINKLRLINLIVCQFRQALSWDYNSIIISELFLVSRVIFLLYHIVVMFLSLFSSIAFILYCTNQSSCVSFLHFILQTQLAHPVHRFRASRGRDLPASLAVTCSNAQSHLHISRIFIIHPHQAGA